VTCLALLELATKGGTQKVENSNFQIHCGELLTGPPSCKTFFPGFRRGMVELFEVAGMLFASVELLAGRRKCQRFYIFIVPCDMVSICSGLA